MKILGGIQSTGVRWYRSVFNLAKSYQKSDYFWESFVFLPCESVLSVKLIHYMMSVVSLKEEREWFRGCVTSCLFRSLFPNLFLPCRLQRLETHLEEGLRSGTRADVGTSATENAVFNTFPNIYNSPFFFFFLPAKCSKVLHKPKITKFLSVCASAFMILKHKILFSAPRNLLRLKRMYYPDLIPHSNYFS